MSSKTDDVVQRLRFLATDLIEMADRFDNCASNDVNESKDDGDQPPQRKHPDSYLIEICETRLAVLAEREYENRRLRNSYLDCELFGEAAWDILLDLFIQRAQGRKVPVTSSCIAADVPMTTALRYVTSLEQMGFIKRQQSRSDQRTRFLELTDEAVSRMSRYLRDLERAS